MRTSGLSHLTAVSGANCAVAVGAVFWLTAMGGGGRVLRGLLAGLALGGFVVLVTPEPSVIRAAVIASVAMLTVLCGMPSVGMLSLCVADILLADPWIAGILGFSLSVAASGALILLAPALARGLGWWMAASVAMAIAVLLAAQLACGPIIALFAEQQSLIGVAANIVAAPAAPIGTVITLLACVVALVAVVSVACGVVVSIPRTGMSTNIGVKAVGWMRGVASGCLLSCWHSEPQMCCWAGRSRPRRPRMAVRSPHATSGRVPGELHTRELHQGVHRPLRGFLEPASTLPPLQR